MLFLLLVLQTAVEPAASASAPEPVPQRFSILEPVTPEECLPGRDPNATVVVCGQRTSEQAVPLWRDYVYKTPRPSNPELTGTGALAASADPCATLQGGCQVGFGPPIMPVAKALVGLVRDATRRRPDRAGRVAIPLDPAVPLPGYAVSRAAASTSAVPTGSAIP